MKEGFQKKAKPGTLKEMTGKFSLKKQTNIFWGYRRHQKQSKKKHLVKAFTTHMKDKVLQFLLYKKACISCHKKKKFNREVSKGYKQAISRKGNPND